MKQPSPSGQDALHHPLGIVTARHVPACTTPPRAGPSRAATGARIDRETPTPPFSRNSLPFPAFRNSAPARFQKFCTLFVV
ncbi:MAG: hypothetical protein GYA24_25280 [Candidatus Lokiarchaeota archaeon]|nr:hypothetical protein [Candidatus Lokiarchaeota archaeon]